MSTWREIVREALTYLGVSMLLAILIVPFYRALLPSILEKLLP